LRSFVEWIFPGFYRYWALRLAYRCHVTVWTPEYRLAPEHPFPAALDDAKTAYATLLKMFSPKDIVFGGDSAGGGLVLATLMRLREEGMPLPHKAFLISPYADLSASNPSMKMNQHKDLWLSRRAIQRWAPLYHGNTPVTDPGVSPTRGQYHGLPPLLILAAENEVLLDDSVQIAKKAHEAGVEATLEIVPKMQHAWPVALPHLAESKTALQTIARFLD
jgi:acetyl esterase/lipase